MSTHRKIEWALFILGIVGMGVAFTATAYALTGLFAVSTLFAGLHVFHLSDGEKANNVIMYTSLPLVVLSDYHSFVEGRNELYWCVGISVLLLLLSLRLRRDFRTVR